MVFGKKAIEWYDEGMKLLREGNSERAIECFKKAYDECGNVRRGESPQRMKAIALNGMGKAYAFEKKYEDALACFDKSLLLILAEKGKNKDPFFEDKEVSDETWSQIINDPLAYICYADKAIALKDFAIKEGKGRFDQLIQQSRKILDKLLKSTPTNRSQMELAARLARERCNLIFILAKSRHPQAFQEANEKIVAAIDTIKSTYQELGYTENEIMFDFELAGIKQKSK